MSLVYDHMELPEVTIVRLEVTEMLQIISESTLTVLACKGQLRRIR
jgi:hypothetical protein